METRNCSRRILKRLPVMRPRLANQRPIDIK